MRKYLKSYYPDILGVTSELEGFGSDKIMFESKGQLYSFIFHYKVCNECERHNKCNNRYASSIVVSDISLYLLSRFIELGMYKEDMISLAKRCNQFNSYWVRSCPITGESFGKLKEMICNFLDLDISLYKGCVDDKNIKEFLMTRFNLTEKEADTLIFNRKNLKGLL